jgi:thaumatin family protein
MLDRISERKHPLACITSGLCAVAILLLSTLPVLAQDISTHPRLKIINGCSEAISINHIVGAGGGTLTAPNPAVLQPSGQTGDSVTFNIPDKGLAGTRFWPSMKVQCADGSSGCSIGESGGPGLACPGGIGCAPPVDSKFEGTFGCFAAEAAKGNCQINPSGNGAPLPDTDGWDTSMVDGYTLPYKVEIKGSCPNGPKKNKIDCSGLNLSQCPVNEDLSTNGAYPALANEDLALTFPTSSGGSTDTQVGCYSPCSKLSIGIWQNIPNPPFSDGPATYQPSAPQADYYCCKGSVGVEACRNGPVVKTSYVKMIHEVCPQTYAYAYDDGTGNFSCPATAETIYEVTFFCPLQDS